MSISNPTPSAPATATPALSRTNLILGVILLLQLAVTAYFYWPTQSAVTTGEHLLADVTTDAVTALTITDNNDRSVSFVKEGDTWTLADTDGYPARAQKITDTLDKLTAMTTDRLVTQTSGSHDRLQVAEGNYLREVDITTASGTQTLYFGSSTGASATHVRAADNAATYLTSEIATWELDTLATTWIEVAYFKVPKAQITEITLENANGTFTFVPVDESGEAGEAAATQWTLADATPDEPIAPANVNTFIDRIATINLHSVLGKSDSPDYGLDAPLATVTVTTSEVTTGTTPAATNTTTLVIGAKDDEENTYYLKSSDSDFYVRLAAFTGDDLVNKQRSDFMVQADEQSGAAQSGDASVAPSTSESPATEPVVSSSEVTTTTSAIESQTVPTATIEASTTATTTVSVDESASPTATVDAGTPTTDTVSSNSSITDTVTPDSDTSPEPEATTTPVN